MSEFKVEIKRLPAMRVACVRAVSEAPEHDAWEKLRAWAEPKGLLDNIEEHPVYGFNNPNPSEGRTDYGYEFWIQVGPDAESEGEVTVREFEGGRYAVTPCRLIGDPSGEPPEVWMKLYEWVKASDEYEWRQGQDFEKPQNLQSSDEELVLDLYLPIKE